MDITGHFESASCVIEVAGSDTLAQVKGKLLAELGVPRARHVGVRMRGGGDIGDDDLCICDTVIDEGCAVELYYAGANITPGVIPNAGKDTYRLTLSPCDRYLAVLWCAGGGTSIFDTETHECLCSFPCDIASVLAFSPCSKWISSVNRDTQCVEVHDVKTGVLEHSFGDGDAGDERRGTAWSPCGTKLLSCCESKGLQVWNIATGVVVHEWIHIEESDYVMVATGHDRVAMISMRIVTVWDYTTGVEVFVLTCPTPIHFVALSPNERFIAACGNKCVRVWNIETDECVFEDDTGGCWTDVAVSNDIVAVCSPMASRVCSISTAKELFRREFNCITSYGLAISSCGGVVMYGDEGIELFDISHLS